MNEHGSGLNIITNGQGGDACCSLPENPFLVKRREFLKVAGLGLVGSMAGSAPTVMAGKFTAEDLKHGMLIPADKKLDQEWVRNLFDRGVKEVYRGESLQHIGMPCGGIGAGQLYLRGDGALVAWKIFNGAKDGWGEAAHTIYRELKSESPVQQGFALTVRQGNQSPSLHQLTAEEFSDVSFEGEYPIGTVRYADDTVPVSVEMEAFSPFIPMNAKDSALPATLFRLTLRNNSSQPVRAGIAGWLENAVCNSVDPSLPGQKVTALSDEKGRRAVLHRAVAGDPQETQSQRAPIVFENFEGPDFKNWQVEGRAFGDKPLAGTAPNQGGVTGFEGKGLVNSFVDGDQPRGKMMSKQFTIERSYINLLVGGGGHKAQTCVNLVVDGKTLHTATGQFAEHLMWQTWEVAELAGSKAQIEIVDQSSSGWGHVLVDQIEFSDSRRSGKDDRFERSRDFGSMALACSDPAVEWPQDIPLPKEIDKSSIVTQGNVSKSVQDKLVGVLSSREFELAPDEEKQVVFVLAWHFPNAQQGNYYATQFEDAAAVVDYVFDNQDWLAGETRLWRDVYYDSTLPFWLLDRLMSTVSTLATGTCQWWADGRFYAFEGVWCCPGTCTHVWNYAQAHARLFPELSRSVREMQDFNPRATGGGYHTESGLVGFRGNDDYAADGQCGTVLKAYREHQASADNSFLQRFWPRIKQALLYSIEQDANSDGLIENSQHNTYDINYEGPNTFVGSLYLAALRAGEEMAKEIGDLPFASHCRAIYESGLRLTQVSLWNGEYFVQDVDLEKHPRNQYGQGCLSDQVFGQGWAHQLNLGYIYPREMVASALNSVWKYNWAPDIGPYNEAHKPFRWFITPGRAGLFTCTWPKSEYLPDGTSYKNEVWSGIEYQVAGHMIAEDMVTEGLAICRAIHDRYQPEWFNPYNEIECGDHYARAMASWSVLLALSGYKYHGPQGSLGFAPKISPEQFKVAFTAAEGWGSFQQDRDAQGQTEQVTLAWGQLRLNELQFQLEPNGKLDKAVVNHNASPVTAELSVEGQNARLSFSEPLVLHAGDTLRVRFTR
ncbi:MAG: hypothetical protein KDA57_15900 [Planctomycetales bacterium]|nr:hypothetical protein [Planctomycetales bacterium]